MTIREVSSTGDTCQSVRCGGILWTEHPQEEGWSSHRNQGKAGLVDRLGVARWSCLLPVASILPVGYEMKSSGVGRAYWSLRRKGGKIGGGWMDERNVTRQQPLRETWGHKFKVRLVGRVTWFSPVPSPCLDTGTEKAESWGWLEWYDRGKDVEGKPRLGQGWGSEGCEEVAVVLILCHPPPFYHCERRSSPDSNPEAPWPSNF